MGNRRWATAVACVVLLTLCSSALAQTVPAFGYTVAGSWHGAVARWTERSGDKTIKWQVLALRGATGMGVTFVPSPPRIYTQVTISKLTCFKEGSRPCVGTARAFQLEGDDFTFDPLLQEVTVDVRARTTTWSATNDPELAPKVRPRSKHDVLWVEAELGAQVEVHRKAKVSGVIAGVAVPNKKVQASIFILSSSYSGASACLLDKGAPCN